MSNSPSESPPAADLPFAAGPPAVRGRIRAVPEDFQVVEELPFAPAGDGEHVYLRVRKRGANTDWVARQLAAGAGVRPSAVSYAGLKDRHAVTEQWFSVHLPGRTEPDWTACSNDEFTVLESCRHHRKLRRGALKGNAFTLVIRDLEGDIAELQHRWLTITAGGVPNYFGEQRFGRGGGNLARVDDWFAGREPIHDRQQRSLMLSAARSWLFNRVLVRRVAEGTWNRIQVGDLAMLDGSHSVFAVGAVDAEIERRAGEFDIHPTGPLWGTGELRTAGAVRELELAVATEFADRCRGLEQAGLEQERRALRIALQQPELRLMAEATAEIQFRLPAGAYATTVLRELVSLES